MKNTFLLSFFFLCSISSLEMSFFYEEQLEEPKTEQELDLVEHAKSSFSKAVNLESKLVGIEFKEHPLSATWKKENFDHIHTMQDIPLLRIHHLMNNLASYYETTHLHVGLLAGDSFIATQYRNAEQLRCCVGLDWFMECSKEVFYANADQYILPESYSIIDSSCYQFDKTLIPEPINLYFYDADHCLIGHENAFTYYDDCFADLFIAVIDDWSCPWIRKPTFNAFKKLGYTVLYQAYLEPGESSFENGQYIAVIRR